MPVNPIGRRALLGGLIASAFAPISALLGGRGTNAGARSIYCENGPWAIGPHDSNRRQIYLGDQPAGTWTVSWTDERGMIRRKQVWHDGSGMLNFRV